MTPRTRAISGLYAVTPDVADTVSLLAKTHAALAGGVRWLQYRNKTAAASVRSQQAMALLEACRQHGARLIVNDHVGLAREIGADGVHIGAEDTGVAEARAALGPHKIIGASCYNDLQRALVAAEQGANYVAFGSFFASQIKPGAVRASLSILRAAKQQIALPTIAIGGITLANAREVIDAGADAIAVISALFDAPDIEAAARALCALFEDEAA